MRDKSMKLSTYIVVFVYVLCKFKRKKHCKPATVIAKK